MFGVVPKPLWSRQIPPDDRNRISLALRCLLIEHDDELVLVDTGVGNKENEKFADIYGIENAGREGPTQLEDAILAAGHRPEDIGYVINTHLHFDHAGGNTALLDDAEGPVPAFPNADYVVQEKELEFAMHTNERTAGSYFRPNFEPIRTAGSWHLVMGETELLPGIRLVPTPGHVPYHQSVVISDGGQTACFLGDLVPTSRHLPLPWIMGYDLEPMVTLETKRTLLAKADAEDWILVFEHDPERAVGTIVREGKSYSYRKLDTPERD